MLARASISQYRLSVGTSHGRYISPLFDHHLTGYIHWPIANASRTSVFSVSSVFSKLLWNSLPPATVKADFQSDLSYWRKWAQNTA